MGGNSLTSLFTNRQKKQNITVAALWFVYQYHPLLVYTLNKPRLPPFSLAAHIIPYTFNSSLTVFYLFPSVIAVVFFIVKKNKNIVMV